MAVSSVGALRCGSSQRRPGLYNGCIRDDIYSLRGNPGCNSAPLPPSKQCVAPIPPCEVISEQPPRNRCENRLDNRENKGESFGNCCLFMTLLRPAPRNSSPAGVPHIESPKAYLTSYHLLSLAPSANHCTVTPVVFGNRQSGKLTSVLPSAGELQAIDEQNEGTLPTRRHQIARRSWL